MRFLRHLLDCAKLIFAGEPDAVECQPETGACERPAAPAAGGTAIAPARCVSNYI